VPVPTSNLLVDQYVECTGAQLEFQSLISAKKTLLFNAFLTDFSESFASTWNTEDVFGRMDPIASFKNTKRVLTLAWDVPAHNIAEAKSNMEKIGHLTRMLYPAYTTKVQTSTEDTTAEKKAEDAAKPSEEDAEAVLGATLTTSAHTQTLSKPPLIKIRYSNLLRSHGKEGQLGFIDNFNFKPVLEMGYFFSDDKPKQMYPKVFSLSLNFNVLHQTNLGYSSDGKWIGGKNFPF
tara:strand:+ start:3329 stop:4030 length:702 start_codon:yes stop_codon:yes gene_type:complete